MKANCRQYNWFLAAAVMLAFVFAMGGVAVAQQQPSRQAASAQPGKFCFLIFAGADEEIVRQLAPAIESEFGFAVEILEKRPKMPASAYDKKRKQYSAARVLEEAMSHRPAECLRLLAFVPGDLFLGRQPFTFGLADTDWRGAVVSFARIGSGERQRFFLRAFKLSMHELGHTFGLGHCALPHTECIMPPPRGISELDAAPNFFCRSCRKKLDDAIRQLRVELADTASAAK